MPARRRDASSSRAPSCSGRPGPPAPSSRRCISTPPRPRPPNRSSRPRAPLAGARVFELAARGAGPGLRHGHPAAGGCHRRHRRRRSWPSCGDAAGPGGRLCRRARPRQPGHHRPQRRAAGAGGVVCCAGSVDVFNPKTVRASAGMLFHLPVVVAGDADRGARRAGRVGAAALGHGGPDRVRLHRGRPGPARSPWSLGNEAHGLAASLAAHLDGTLSHPDGRAGGVAQRGDGGRPCCASRRPGSAGRSAEPSGHGRATARRRPAWPA